MAIITPIHPGIGLNCVTVLQDAIASASPGDTILIENSANNGESNEWILISPTSGGAPTAEIAALNITVADLIFNFQDDAYWMAGEDSFHPVYCSMIQARNIDGISFIFDNVNSGIRMRRADYLGPYDQPGNLNINGYLASEFRNCIAIFECDDFYMEGGTLQLSGGDGLIIEGSQDSGTSALQTPCHNVIVNDTIFSDNIRQGVSVISVDGLRLNRCQFNGSFGRPPQAGIDFEPWHPMASLLDIVLTDCTGDNNASSAVYINTARMIKTAGSYPRPSHPIDITIIQTRATGSTRDPWGINYLAWEGETNGGTVKFIGLHTTNLKSAGIHILWRVGSDVKLIFEDCVIDHVSDTSGEKPIEIKLYDEGVGSTVGGIFFDKLAVIDDVDRKIVNVTNDATTRPSGGRCDCISGLVLLEPDGFTPTVEQFDNTYPKLFHARLRKGLDTKNRRVSAI